MRLILAAALLSAAAAYAQDDGGNGPLQAPIRADHAQAEGAVNTGNFRPLGQKSGKPTTYGELNTLEGGGGGGESGGAGGSPLPAELQGLKWKYYKDHYAMPPEGPGHKYMKIGGARAGVAVGFTGNAAGGRCAIAANINVDIDKPCVWHLWITRRDSENPLSPACLQSASATIDQTLAVVMYGPESRALKNDPTGKGNARRCMIQPDVQYYCRFAATKVPGKSCDARMAATDLK